jgi:hypothetical protein
MFLIVNFSLGISILYLQLNKDFIKHEPQCESCIKILPLYYNDIMI